MQKNTPTAAGSIRRAALSAAVVAALAPAVWVSAQAVPRTPTPADKQALPVTPETGFERLDDLPVLPKDGEARATTPATGARMTTPATPATPARAGNAQARPMANGEMNEMARAFPSEDAGVVRVTKSLPQQIRVGQPFEYTLALANLTDGSVSDVSVSESDIQGFTIQSADPEPASNDDGKVTWNLGEMAEGGNQTITVTAIANQAGQLMSCVTPTYQQSLCMTAEAVNPAIAVTKAGPEQVNICDPFAYTYTVRNTGTGAARNVVLVDNLPDGLMTEDGQQVVNVPVGELAQGASKDVKVNLKAAETGTYTSPAEATSADLQVYSGNVTTDVIGADLTVDVTGPDYVYLGETAQFVVTVTNDGEGAARDATVAFDLGKEENPVATATTGRDRQPSRTLGTIEPGESSTFRVDVVGRTEGPMTLGAVASAECATDTERATASAPSYVVTVPALLLETVDRVDPIKVGENEVYTITVKNQGTGADKNVTLSATLPQGMSFVSAEGPTEVTASGQNLTFAPLSELAGGDAVSWYVTGKVDAANEQGRFKLNMKSDFLTSPVGETEPTRLYQ